MLETTDVAAAGAILRQALAPFRMFPEAQGHRMTGALDLRVCDERVAGARYAG
jgi:hypothetical protein